MCNLSDAIEERGIKKGIERGIERGIEQGLKRGLSLGEEKKLIEQVCRKMQKNKDVMTIARELEEEEAVIQRIYDAAVPTAPEYDKQRVYEILHS